MHARFRAVLLAVATLPGLAAANSASAERSVPPSIVFPVENVPTLDAPETIEPFAGPALPSAALERVTGREDVAQLAQSDHTATVTENSIGDNSVTGDVGVTDSAFQNLSGLSVININTGNNVAVNAAINLNISLTPQ
jgi:hypothetical protein